MPDARRSNKVKPLKDYEEMLWHPEEVTVKQEEKETVSIMLHRSKIVKIRGEVTGKQYIFNGGGSIVEVDKKDVEGMMRNNRVRQSCCGSFSSPYFSIV